MTTSNLQTLQELSLSSLLESGWADLVAEQDQANKDAQDIANSQLAMCVRVRALFHPSLHDYVSVGEEDYRNGIPNRFAGAHIELPNALRVSFSFSEDETGSLKIDGRRPLFSVWGDYDCPIEETDDLSRALAVAIREYVPPAPPKPPAPPTTDWLTIATQHLDNSTTSTFCADAEVCALRAIAGALIAIAENRPF